MKKGKSKLIPELRFPEFKDEGEWDVKSIGEVFKTFSGGTPNTSEGEYYGGTIPFIRSAEISREQTELFLTEEGLKNSSSKLVNKGDLLVALYGANSGDSAVSKINGAINQAILCLQSEYSNTYTYHFLTFKKNWIVSRFIQGGQGNLSGDIVKSITVPFPKKSEQKKVASCLSSLDEVIAAHSQKLELFKEHKRGLMQNLFPQEGEKVPKYRFPEFKKDGDWAERTLGEIGDFKNGINFSPDKRGSGILTIDVLNMYGQGIVVKMDSLYRVDTDANDYLLKQNDILFVRSSMKKEGIGWTTLFDGFREPVIYCGFLIRLRIHSSKSILPKYIIYYLRSEIGRRKIISLAGAAAITNISQDSLKSILIHVPKPKEQEKISECLSSLDALINVETQKIEQMRLHKKGLMQALFPNMND
jgi:type I restriction enzyme S subunit